MHKITFLHKNGTRRLWQYESSMERAEKTAKNLNSAKLSAYVITEYGLQILGSFRAEISEN